MIIKKHCQPGEWRNREGWLPKCAWPEDCIIQWGGGKNKFFFEAYPNSPMQTFLTGHGETLETAEVDAFAKFESYCKCPNHEFERRHYTNGVGFCKHCNMFKSRAFEPDQPCCQCNNKNGYGCDNQGRWWCEACYSNMPKEIWPEWRFEMEEEEKLPPLTEEQLYDALNEVFNNILGK